MQIKVKKTLYLIVVMFILLIMNACTSESDSKESAASTDGNTDLKVALSAAPPSLDFQHTTVLVAMTVGWHIVEPLVTIDENYQPVPYLAKSIDVSDDGKTITLPLREGITFHNGKEMTSEDVVASLNRWKDISSVGKVAMAVAEDIIAEDQYTVSITLSKPSSSVIYALAFPFQGAVVMPKEIIEKYGDLPIEEMIGTGPFEFAEWKQDQYIHLKKFEDHQPLEQEVSGLAGKREALVDNLYIMLVPDLSTRESGLLSGEYDVAEDLSTDNYDMLREHDDIDTVIASPQGYISMNFNLKDGIFKSQEVRQAVNTALDNEAIMLAAQGSPDFYRLDHGLMFQEQAWYSEAGKELYHQNDLEKGKQMLEAADYNGEEVTILATRDLDYIYNSSIVLRNTLEAMGMNVKLEVYDWATMADRRSDPETWDIFFTEFPVYIDPGVIIFLHSQGGWFTGYESAEMDALLEKVQETLDFGEAKVAFEQAQELFWNDVPYVKVGEVNSLIGHNQSVKNFDYFMQMYFWNVSHEK